MAAQRQAADVRMSPVGMNTNALARRATTPTEKQVEASGRRIMSVLGFTCWHLSQARPTAQSPGWPDMLFTHPDKRLAVYWEAKRPGGAQSDAQRVFQKHVTAAGHEYVCGTENALAVWAEAKGLCRLLPGGGIEVIR